MIKRNDGGALPAVGDIIRSQVTDHVDPTQRGKQRTIANLPRPALIRTMQDGMTVKSNDIDGAFRKFRIG